MGWKKHGPKANGPQADHHPPASPVCMKSACEVEHADCINTDSFLGGVCGCGDNENIE